MPDVCGVVRRAGGHLQREPRRPRLGCRGLRTTAAGAVYSIRTLMSVLGRLGRSSTHLDDTSDHADPSHDPAMRARPFRFAGRRSLQRSSNTTVTGPWQAAQVGSSRVDGIGRLACGILLFRPGSGQQWDNAPMFINLRRTEQNARTRPALEPFAFLGRAAQPIPGPTRPVLS
jgi:hypothetical protein